MVPIVHRSLTCQPSSLSPTGGTLQRWDGHGRLVLRSHQLNNCLVRLPKSQPLGTAPVFFFMWFPSRDRGWHVCAGDLLSGTREGRGKGRAAGALQAPSRSQPASQRVSYSFPGLGFHHHECRKLGMALTGEGTEPCLQISLERLCAWAGRD